MKSGTLWGMMTGAAIATAAVYCVGTMNGSARRKLKKMAATSGQKITDKANEWLG